MQTVLVFEYGYEPKTVTEIFDRLMSEQFGEVRTLAVEENETTPWIASVAARTVEELSQIGGLLQLR